MSKRIVLILLIVFSGCATSGTRQIQTKCKPVQDLADTWVCEAP